MRRCTAALCVAIFFCLALGGVCCVQAEETVRVGCSDQLDVFSGGSSGAELLAKIASYTGRAYECVYASSGALLSRLRSGDIDVIMGVAESHSIENYVDLSNVFIASEDGVLLALKTKKLYYEDYSAFDGMKIGFFQDADELNSAFADYAKAHGFVYSSQSFSNSESAFEALHSGGIDALACSTQLSRPSTVESAAVFFSDKLYFGALSTNAATLDEIDSALARLLTDDPDFAAGLYTASIASDRLPITRQEAEFLQDMGALVVGCYSDCPPYCYYNETDKRFEGVLIDILNTAASSAGIRVVFKAVPPGSGSPASYLQSSDARVFAGLFQTSVGTQGEITQGSSILNEPVFIVTQEQWALDDLPSPRFALPRQYADVQMYLAANYRNVVVVEIKDNVSDCLAAINRGDADATLMSQYMLSYYFNRNKDNSLVALPVKFLSQNVQLGFKANEDPRLVSLVNKATEQLGRGALKDIVLQNTVYHTDSLLASKQNASRRNMYAFINGLFIISLLLAASYIAYQLYQRSCELKRKELLGAQLTAALKDAKTQKQLVAGLSHDMRTPLESLKGTLMLASDCASPEVREYISAALLTADRIGKQLDSVLGNADMRESIFSYGVEADSPELVDRIEALMLPAAKEKGVRLTYEVNSVPLRGTYANKLRLEQMLLPMLVIALRHTPRGGGVHYVVDLDRTPGGTLKAALMVTMDGGGLKQGRIAGINVERSDELSVVSRMCELLGGKLELSGKRGEVLSAVFETKEAIAYTTQYDDARSKLVEDAFAKLDLTDKRLLVVEDHEVNMIVTTKLFTGMGFTVDQARNGKQALDMFQGSRIGYYDMIFMDIRMPVMTGLEAAAEIRKLDRLDAAVVPIVAMTANALSEDVKTSYDAGMNYHLSKPVDMLALKDILVRELDQ